jgi:hypothetical protein
MSTSEARSQTTRYDAFCWHLPSTIYIISSSSVGEGTLRERLSKTTTRKKTRTNPCRRSHSVRTDNTCKAPSHLSWAFSLARSKGPVITPRSGRPLTNLVHRLRKSTPRTGARTELWKRVCPTSAAGRGGRGEHLQVLPLENGRQQVLFSRLPSQEVSEMCTVLPGLFPSMCRLCGFIPLILTCRPPAADTIPLPFPLPAISRPALFIANTKERFTRNLQRSRQDEVRQPSVFSRIRILFFSSRRRARRTTRLSVS